MRNRRAIDPVPSNRRMEIDHLESLEGGQTVDDGQMARREANGAIIEMITMEGKKPVS